NRPIPVSIAAGDSGFPVADEEEDEEEQEDATAWAVENSPPWLVSLVFHTIVLIILGIWGFMNLPDDSMQLEMVYAEKLGEQIEDDLFQAADSDLLEIEKPVMSLDEEFVDDPLAAPPELEFTIDALKATSDLSTPSIGLALTGREKGMKEALLAAYGGTATTEAAVKMGLEWLKKNQGKDGLWSLTGPYSTGSGVENRAAATAMALLAFQGAGHTHKTGEHREVVARGWAAMLRMQDADGNFFKEGSFHHRLYTHAQATIALCELYGMTRDAKYKAPAQKALDYCFRIQSPAGGWRYAPNGESDTSVTGWFVMALQSGLMAGLKVPSEKLIKISQYLDAATTDGGSQYGYRLGYGEKISMTAEGLLCRQYLGWKHDDPRLIRGANIVGENPMNWNEQDVYYWYYATQMLHHMGGEWWNKWNRVMRQTVPEHQTTVGREKGSWSPSDDAWGHQGGRLFTTCLSIYMLEVYYRHLPIYKSKLR
ncbi:MAG: prenyltransferase/squalene oxidase repeat-containing protein, partial [Pirellulaceae bacterium]